MGLIALQRPLHDADRLTGDPAKMASATLSIATCGSTIGDRSFETYLADPDKSPDELDYAEGEGLGAAHFSSSSWRRCAPRSKGEPRCLLSVVDRTVEVQAENERCAPKCCATA